MSRSAIAYGVAPTRPRFAPAHAGPVERDRIEIGKQRSDAAPLLQIVGVAVEKHDRRAAPAAKKANALAADVVNSSRQHAWPRDAAAIRD